MSEKCGKRSAHALETRTCESHRPDECSRDGNVVKVEAENGWKRESAAATRDERAQARPRQAETDMDVLLGNANDADIRADEISRSGR